MKGRFEEAKKILLQASKANKTCLSENSCSILDKKPKLIDSDEEIKSTDNSKRTSTTQIVLLIANISYLWFATIFVYYGLNINSVYLEYWDKYYSYIVSRLFNGEFRFLLTFHN